SVQPASPRPRLRRAVGGHASPPALARRSPSACTAGTHDSPPVQPASDRRKTPPNPAADAGSGTTACSKLRWDVRRRRTCRPAARPVPSLVATAFRIACCKGSAVDLAALSGSCGQTKFLYLGFYYCRWTPTIVSKRPCRGFIGELGISHSQLQDFRSNVDLRRNVLASQKGVFYEQVTGVKVC